MSMRTPVMDEEYQIAKESGLLVPLFDEAPVREWKYWRLVVNKYWHDKVARFGLMVVLKRECPSIWRIEKKERAELFEDVGPWCDSRFDTFDINLKSMRSIENIPHIHVKLLKEDYK